jgi:hypothetical protein
MFDRLKATLRLVMFRGSKEKFMVVRSRGGDVLLLWEDMNRARLILVLTT